MLPAYGPPTTESVIPVTLETDILKIDVRRDYFAMALTRSGFAGYLN